MATCRCTTTAATRGMTKVRPHSSSTRPKARTEAEDSYPPRGEAGHGPGHEEDGASDAIAEAVMIRGRREAAKVFRNSASRVALAATRPATRAHAQSAARRALALEDAPRLPSLFVSRHPPTILRHGVVLWA